MRSLFTLLFLFSVLTISAQNKKVIYCLPGQGADSRQFEHLQVDTSVYEVQILEYDIEFEGQTMAELAYDLSKEINDDRPFILLGVSLGGMLCMEINAIKQAEKIILISSAAGREELPGRYTIQRHTPLYQRIPESAYVWGASFLQPLVEPDSKNVSALCHSMLSDKDPSYMKRSVEMILEWDRSVDDTPVIHLHGNKDHTLPARKIPHINYLIDGGSHMMILTRTDEINRILQEVLVD